MKTTVSSNGQIVLPAEFRALDRIEPGQEFDVERLDRGEYRLVRRMSPRNHGAIDWLFACPTKGYFVAVDSESTSTDAVTYLGDANVLSEPTRPAPNQRVTQWLRAHEKEIAVDQLRRHTSR